MKQKIGIVLAIIVLAAGMAVNYVATRTEGSFFGEAALITGDPRNATVQARGEVTLYALDKATFQATLDANSTLKEQVIQTFFQRQ